MKKFLLSLSFVVAIAAMMVSCGGGDKPEANAEKFLKAFYTYDFEAAKAVGTDDTKAFIGQYASMTSMMPDSLKDLAKKTKVEIDAKAVKVEGDVATVPYTITPPAGAGANNDPVSLKLKMEKKDGKWLAVMTKAELEAQAKEQMAKEGGQTPTAEGPVEEMEAGATAPVAADSAAAKK